MAESVRFELTVHCCITSFQDWLLKPLGQLSVRGKSYHFARKKSSYARRQLLEHYSPLLFKSLTSCT